MLIATHFLGLEGLSVWYCFWAVVERDLLVLESDHQSGFNSMSPDFHHVISPPSNQLVSRGHTHGCAYTLSLLICVFMVASLVLCVYHWCCQRL